MHTVPVPTSSVVIGQEHSEESNAILYMQIWMTLGTVCGGALGYFEFTNAYGTYVPFVTLLSAVTGATVGAAVGQLIAGLFHVIAHRSLD